MTKLEVVGLGALNMDNIYRVERLSGDRETAANTIYGLANLGVKAGFIGAIGDDTEGKILLQDFTSAV